VSTTGLYVTPRAIMRGTSAAQALAAGVAWSLSGDAAFGAVEISVREKGQVRRVGLSTHASLDSDIADTTLRTAIESHIATLAMARGSFAGFSPAQPLVMGVLNVTPDSFSDGGRYGDAESAVAHALKLVDAGAQIIDVGGESTRPGAMPISDDVEIARVVPVIKALAARGVCVSIDTRHAQVMAEAIAAGAKIVNDVSALAGEPASLEIVARLAVPVILMHMQGEPSTMQDNPNYVWAPGDIYDYLSERVSACIAAGIPKSRIAVDPGLGFGKTDLHNVQLLDHLPLLLGLSCPVAVGASRKGFISRMSRGEPADARLGGSVAAAVYAVGQGAGIVRVHDVAETCQALAVTARMATGV